MNETIMLQIPISKELHTRFKIKCLKVSQGQKAAITEMIEYFLSEPKLKDDEKK